MIADISVIDNFYPDPDKIRQLVSDFPIQGCGTGNRSIGLQQIDYRLYDDFCNTICKIHNIPSMEGLHMFTFFMEHEYNPIEVFNKGWAHIDGKNPDACRMTTEDYKLVVCGQIQLSKDADPDAGVNIFKLKDSVTWSQQELYDRAINDYTLPKEMLMRKEIDLAGYEQMHIDYHSHFDLTCSISNVYNRLISWQAGTLHSQVMTQKQSKRLNQYWFIQRI